MDAGKNLRMDAGGIGPPPSRCKREGLPLAYASAQKIKIFITFKLLVLIPKT